MRTKVRFDTATAKVLGVNNNLRPVARKMQEVV